MAETLQVQSGVLLSTSPRRRDTPTRSAAVLTEAGVDVFNAQASSSLGNGCNVSVVRNPGTPRVPGPRQVPLDEAPADAVVGGVLKKKKGARRGLAESSSYKSRKRVLVCTQGLRGRGQLGLDLLGACPRGGACMCAK